MIYIYNNNNITRLKNKYLREITVKYIYNLQQKQTH